MMRYLAVLAVLSLSCCICCLEGMTEAGVDLTEFSKDIFTFTNKEDSCL